MCVAAAFEIAKTAEDKGLSDEYIVPKMSEWEVFPREAAAVGMKAIAQGIARVKYNKNELYEIAEKTIKKARDETHILMKHGIIEMPSK
jgi:malate dehydrogenase (oxaloacetate-decarboxylating)